MINFRKVASVLASAAMMSSTVALGAAANYPAPHIAGGNADVAVVYGSSAAATDLVAVTDITSNLQASLASQTATGGTASDASISGEAAPLFSGSTKLYINDTIDSVKSVLSDSEMPALLVDGSVSGNVDTTYTQTIDIGFNPQVTFAKQPTSSEDPIFGIQTSTTAANYIYNATVTFNKAINLTHADTEGEDLTLFGQKFTIASATSDTQLVLLKTAEKISLSSDDPTAEVTIEGASYTVELVSASDTTATVKVTDSSGNSETKEISENASKKTNGITVAITNADETNLKLSASIVAGSEKVTMSTTAASAITEGEEDTVIDGTSVTITGGTTAATKITVSIYAPNSDEDAIIPEQEFVDPVYGSFKVDFSGLNIEDDSTARETISVGTEGDDRLSVTLTDYNGNTKTIQYAKNWSNGVSLQYDEDGRNITVAEGQNVKRNEYLVVGNEDEGRLVKVSQITNQTTGHSNDKVTFTDVFSGSSYDTTITADGTGTATIGGKVYTVKYSGSASADSNNVTVNYPDSTGAKNMIVYPTIQTSKGAKFAFYEPINISVNRWDGSQGTTNNLSTITFPDGDGYTTATLGNTFSYGSDSTWLNVTVGSTVSILNFSVALNSVNIPVGRLNYNLSSEGMGTTGRNDTLLRLENPQTNAAINDPALIIFEEKDDNNQYQVIVVTTEPGATADDGIGVNDVVRSWGGDARWDAIALASDSKMTKEADLWGTIITVDNSDSDQATATISYPDEQVYAQVYVAGVDSTITPGSVSGSSSVKSLGSVTVSDSEVGSVSAKNLVVVGGSCVNSVAASLLDSSTPLCGADWEAKTGVGSGSFLIETFDRGNGKVATLVAGYNAGDTTNAAKALTTQTVDTSVGKKYTGSTASSVSLA
jgi:hypothetical protein